MALNPLVAAGVRSVEVELSYRSRKLAVDLAAFLEFRKSVLWKYKEDLDDCSDLFEWPERESREGEYDESGSTFTTRKSKGISQPNDTNRSNLATELSLPP